MARVRRRRPDPIGDMFDRLSDFFFGIGEGLTRAVEGFATMLDEGLAGGAADPQQQAVYFWHDHVLDAWLYRRGLQRHLTLVECQAIADEVFAGYGFQGPEVVAVTGNTATGTMTRITLPPHMRTLSTVLHECAHGLDQIFHPFSRQAHGPTFVGILLVLFQDYAGADRKWMLRTLRERGIKHERFRRVKRKRAGKAKIHV